MVGRRPKLTPEQAQRVREWAANRKTAAQLATELGVSRRAIYDYIHGTHKHGG